MLTLTMLLGCIGSCTGGPPEPPHLQAMMIARHPEAIVSIEVPDSNRPDGAGAPKFWPVKGWTRTSRHKGLHVWEAPLPARSEFEGWHRSFRPPGMVLRVAGKRWDFVQRGKDTPRDGTWSWRKGMLLLHTKAKSPPKKVEMRFDRARQVEKELNRKTAAAEDDLGFVLRDETVGRGSRYGVYLPAPAKATWYVWVPENAELDLSASLLPPGVDAGATSDGAKLHIEVDGEEQHVIDLSEPGAVQDARVDLKRFAGQSVELTLRTTPGKNNHLDYVFVSEPRLFDAKRKPKRVLLVFIDTLRQDHVGAYGYERDTTPAIDAVARRGVVYENARSVAPWTMPSGRASVSGLEPERWRQGPHLGEILARHGFTTVAITGNRWLSEAFDFSDGWGVFEYHRGRAADRRDAAMAWAERYQDSDLALLLHIMEPHMPYSEPRELRTLWATDPPEGFAGKITSPQTHEAYDKADATGKEQLRKYLLARYDQNIRSGDDALARILKAFEDDTIVIYSDHGEAFFEHGRFEHGQSLYDHQLRVPLIVKSPALQPGREAKPAVLTDIVPTVLDLMEIESDHTFDGQSLLDSPKERTTAFGWTRDGNEAWGSIVGDRKWITRGGQQRVYDLASDPGEKKDLNAGGALDTKPYQDALAATRKRAVTTAYRVEGPGPEHWDMDPKDIRVEVTHPGGFEHGWTQWNPRVLQAAPVQAKGDKLTMLPSRQARTPREIFGLVKDPAAGEPTLRVRYRGKWYQGEKRGERWVAGPKKARVSLGTHVTPLPVELESYTVSESMQAELEALGYVDR